MKYFIKENEIGLLYKNGQFCKLLLEGKYKTFSKNTKIDILNKKYSLETKWLDSFSFNDDKIKPFLQTIKVDNGYIAFHFIDGIYFNYYLEGTYNFINKPYQHTFIYMNMNDIKIEDEKIKSIVCKSIPLNTSSLIGSEIILDGYVGLLYVDGAFKELLQPNTYYFFKSLHQVVIKKVCMKKQILNVNGQEILSKDKVTIRFNLVLNYQIIDPIKVISQFTSIEEEIHLLTQMKYREYLSEKTLDEMLSEKESVGNIVLKELKKYEKDLGVEFISSGVKDLILPGEIRDILNTVLIAEKKAMANVITRREETASTRSLLNTAKLMEENKTLYRLKELEYLEKIFDKVQTLSLSSSSNALEQLTSLINSDKK